MAGQEIIKCFLDIWLRFALLHFALQKAKAIENLELRVENYEEPETADPPTLRHAQGSGQVTADLVSSSQVSSF